MLHLEVASVKTKHRSQGGKGLGFRIRAVLESCLPFIIAVALVKLLPL